MSDPVGYRELPTVSIPIRIRSFVYLVGMLGFPVIVAGYVLVVLSSDMKTVDKTLSQLATRIDERPMSMEKTTDFIVYLTDSMRNELIAGLGGLVDGLNLTVTDDQESVVRAVNLIKRDIEGFVRPIVRKHQRFASRFPSEGGNLGSYFELSAPSEEITTGDTEAYLAAASYRDFGESLTVLMTNAMNDFGHDVMRLALKDDTAGGNDLLEALLKGYSSARSDDVQPANEVPEENSELRAIENVGSSGGATDTKGQEVLVGEQPNKASRHGEVLIIDKELFEKVCTQIIDSAVIALRDQMLLRSRLQSSELKK